MTIQIIVNIGLWLIMLLLIACTKWDYGVIALGVACLLVVTGCVDANTALGMFSDTNVIVIATIMIVSAGFSRTQAIGKIASLLYKVGQDRFENCLRMFMIVNFILGIFLGAAVTRIAIVYPLILAVCRKAGKSPSKAMFPIGVMLLCDQTYFPLGSEACVRDYAHLFYDSGNQSRSGTAAAGDCRNFCQRAEGESGFGASSGGCRVHHICGDLPVPDFLRKNRHSPVGGYHSCGNSHVPDGCAFS